MKKNILRIVVALIIILVALSLIPLNRTNPAVTREVKWDSDTTQQLARRACMDCHSNATVWPWYSYVAPVSFLVTNHVTEGRQRLNFSTWDQPNAEIEEIVGHIDGGEMPPWNYLLMHSTAKLNAAEKEQLLSGLQATFQQDPPGGQ